METYNLESQIKTTQLEELLEQNGANIQNKG